MTSFSSDRPPLATYQEKLSLLEEQYKRRMKHAMQETGAQGQRMPETQNLPTCSIDATSGTLGLCSYTMSLNQDECVHGPIDLESGIRFSLELYTGHFPEQKPFLTSSATDFEITWKGEVTYQHPNFDTLPLGLQREQLRSIIMLFPWVGRATLTAMPLSSKEYYFIYLAIKEGSPRDRESIIENVQVSDDKVIWGMSHLLVRFVFYSGMPCYNERDDYLLDTCQIEKDSAVALLNTLTKGFHLGIERCRLIYEVTPEWQANVPGEVKTIWW